MTQTSGNTRINIVTELPVNGFEMNYRDYGECVIDLANELEQDKEYIAVLEQAKPIHSKKCGEDCEMDECYPLGALVLTIREK